MAVARRWTIETLPDGVRIVLRPRRTAMRSLVAVLTPAGAIAVCSGMGFVTGRMTGLVPASGAATPGGEPPLWGVLVMVALTSWVLMASVRSLREASWYLDGTESLRLTDREIEHRLRGPGWSEGRTVRVHDRPRVVAVGAFDGPRALASFAPPFFRSGVTWPPWRVLPRRHRDRITWESFLVAVAPGTTVRFGVDVTVEETAPLLADLRAAAPRFADPPAETGVRE